MRCLVPARAARLGRRAGRAQVFELVNLDHLNSKLWAE